MQHRHLAAVAAPFLEHADAVDDRQADVEDHRVIGLGVAEEVALLAVLGGIDRVAGLLQRGDELAVQIGIVFDDQDPHVNSPPFPSKSKSSAAHRF